MGDDTNSTYRDQLNNLKEKSEDDFERLITYISAGALGLSLTFIEKIIPKSEMYLSFILIVAWVLLTMTLLTNLFSHYFSSRCLEKTSDEMKKKIEDKLLRRNVDRRNKAINWINWITMGFLFVGIISLVLFVSLNILNMDDKKKDVDKSVKNELTTPESLDLREATSARGRTIPLPDIQESRTNTDSVKQDDSKKSSSNKK